MDQTADYLLGRKHLRFCFLLFRMQTYVAGINDGTKYILSKRLKASDWKKHSIPREFGRHRTAQGLGFTIFRFKEQ